MSKVIVGMSMSLDGFINDRSGSVAPLYADFEEMAESAMLKDAIANTGAVVMGRSSFEMGEPDSYADTYEFQNPIFVVTHQPPQKHPKENDRLTFTFVTDGIDKDVTVIGGANTIQQILRAGLADEIHIDILPVLLNGGTKLFENTGDEPVMLEKIDVREMSVRTAMRFRVVK
jgi:dihydrofolate reductase